MKLPQGSWLSFSDKNRLGRAVVITTVLAAAVLLGRNASLRWLALLVTAMGAVLLLARPVLGLPVLVVAGLVVPLEFGTGSEVQLNPATLLVPVLLALWMLEMVRHRQLRGVESPVNRPLLLFLVAGLLSLLIGRATWDPMVPMKGNFLLVQLAQWAIFAFSAGAFWLTANLVREEVWLRRLTVTFLALAGSVAILHTAPGLGGITGRLETVAFTRAPLWVLLGGLAGGQLLYNRNLTWPGRAFLVAVAGVCLAYAFVLEREGTSNWVGLTVVLGVLSWLRFRALRWPTIVALIALLAVGILFPAVYNFAGGDQEWILSGESRLTLTKRVLEVAMRNPISGLGPASYRLYAGVQPLVLQDNRLWVGAVVSSHNNYVDLFAHGGVLGLALFAWFVAALAGIGRRLHRRYTRGFAAGYVNGMLAAGLASLVIMFLADWILPFVYNIGFEGFQASVLVWLFMGGLVALDGMADRETGRQGDRERRRQEGEEARGPEKEARTG
jgi:hypothetical protein